MSFMSNFSRWLMKKLKSEKRAKILILGLDSAGKTTLTKFVNTGGFIEGITPTIGQNIDTINFEGWDITTVDVAGQEQFRFLWDIHYPGSSAVIFVIDSADIERLPEARDIMRVHLINNPHLEKVPALILANKQDLPGAIQAPMLIQLLNLHLDMKERTFAVFDCSALTGIGVVQAFTWLVNQLSMDKLEQMA
ncbi:MAG: GTP-binding protein [Candidatus Heimdallarchaeota archaeon]|nr:GTP-binding protein [Candidatus Heimdallarchaeota archaeon]